MTKVRVPMIITVCCVETCRKEISRVTDPSGRGGISHGYCAEHAAEAHAEVDQWIEEEEKKKSGKS